jgi:GT2 family glycosyltransferase
MSYAFKLGICILNWNSGPMLSKCVDRIRRANRNREHHIVVVDNHSSDESIALLRNNFPDTSILQNSKNLGFAKGNNLGARYLLSLGCDALHFVNPDVLINEESCSALLETLNRIPRAGCVGGVAFNNEGISRMVARTRPTPLEKLILYGPLHRIPGLEKYHGRHFLDPETLCDGQSVYAITGACFLFRAAAFEEIGGFDESTFLYEEEFIIAERLKRLGWLVVLCKACIYFHREAQSTDLMPYRRRLHFIQSEQYLLRYYYAWPSVRRHLLRLVRYVEWGVYCVSWLVWKRHAHASEKLHDLEVAAITEGDAAWRP